MRGVRESEVREAPFGREIFRQDAAEEGQRGRWVVRRFLILFRSGGFCTAPIRHAIPGRRRDGTAPPHAIRRAPIAVIRGAPGGLVICERPNMHGSLITRRSEPCRTRAGVTSLDSVRGSTEAIPARFAGEGEAMNFRPVGSPPELVQERAFHCVEDAHECALVTRRREHRTSVVQLHACDAALVRGNEARAAQVVDFDAHLAPLQAGTCEYDGIAVAAQRAHTIDILRDGLDLMDGLEVFEVVHIALGVQDDHNSVSSQLHIAHVRAKGQLADAAFLSYEWEKRDT